MKAIKTVLIMLILFSLTIVACKKEEKAQPTVTSPLQFNSLSAQNTTIAIGATTKITASATGDGLIYSWSASAGDIIGNGSEITYGAPTCCAGQNSITCTVKDVGGNSQVKSVTINVQ